MKKMQLAAVALIGALAACAAQTTTPIQSMSGTGITVAHVDGFAGRKDTDKVAMKHCSGATAVGTVHVISGSALDGTSVRYTC